jgi:MFS family permease
MEELGLSHTAWGTVGSSFFWLFAIGSFVVAAWSDKLGTKKVLILMALAWTIAQFGAYAVTGVGLLITTRIFLGFFEGAYYATAISQMSKWFRPERRAFATSIINAGSTVGSFVAAPLLVYIIQNHGWRHSFGFLGILSLTWLILWAIFGREEPKVSVEDNKPKEMGNLESSKLVEVMPILRSKTFILTCCAYTSFYWFLAWTTTWMPNYLTQAVGMEPKTMGMAVAIIGICSLFITILVCIYSDFIFKKTQSIRSSRVIVSGVCMIVAALVFCALTFIQSPLLIAIGLCIGKGLVFTISPLSAQIMLHLFPGRKGMLLGIMVGIGSLAAIVGPWITGVFIDSAGNNVVLGHNWSILSLAALLIIFGGIFAVFVKPDHAIKDSKDKITTAI